jgi:protein-S-isoprenylcysteine O-methyltransferase Ste14
MQYKFAMSAVTLLMFAILAAFTSWLAGTWQLPFFWVVFATQAAIGLTGLFILDDELIKERIRPRGKDEDPWAPIILTVLCLAGLSLAALDVGRWHFSDDISPPIQIIAVLLQAIGWIGLLWTMQTNRFFSSAVRLQPDRQQEVIKTGPYRWIRHPGYAFSALAFLTQSIAFGSFISLIPALLIVAVFMYRATLEERILKQGLPGYAEFMEQVRFRLLPGIW